MNKVLIFELKSVCYNSYYYFAEQLGSALASAGFEVEYFRLGRDGQLEDIEKYINQSYTAILECNSDLPKITMEDGSLFLNHLNGPFIDVILDHPLYHHDMLKQPLQNFHVFCLDDNHADYIRTYYPHIQSVHMLTMTGTKAVPEIPFSKREIPLLFTGTYTPANEVWDAVLACPDCISRDIRCLIDMMLSNSSLTLEAAVQLLAKDSDSLIDDYFPLHVQAYFLADTYMRSFVREQAVLALADAGLPLTVSGSRWEQLPKKKESALSLHSGVSYEDSFSLMSHAQIVLNVMPLFKAGGHDRIFSAMLNNCACLTDSSSYLNQHFTDGTDIAFYDIRNMDSLICQAQKLLSSPDATKEIADNGCRNAAAHHSWAQRGQTFLAMFLSIVSR